MELPRGDPLHKLILEMLATTFEGRSVTAKGLHMAIACQKSRVGLENVQSALHMLADRGDVTLLDADEWVAGCFREGAQALWPRASAQLC